jgi:hypothetical protein
MWGTAFDPAAVLQFYFDGETEARIRSNIIDFYKGSHPLFPQPLVSYEKRGRWGDAPFAGNSFVPIPFAKSLKISVRGASNFFHIIYEKYPYPANVATFTGHEDRTALLDAFERPGEPPFESAGGTPYATETEIVEPGRTVALLKLEGTPGIIRDILIEGDGAEDFFRSTWIRMRWDGHLRWDVQAPPGMLFGSAVRAGDSRSLPLRVERLPGGKARLRSYFPMPFWGKAEIEWTNASGRPMAPLKARIEVGPNPIPREEGTYFTTLHHDGQTIYGRDWLLFEGTGTGWLAGIVQSMRIGHYCEGNERFTMDGAIAPQIHGTGTEDYYLACFWPNLDFDSPFGGVSGDIQAEGGGDIVGAYHVPASYSRFHLEAPLPFFSSIDARIQHGGRSDILSEYRSLAFAYLRKEERLRVTDVLDVGNAASEAMHSYSASRGGLAVEVAASPDGGDFETLSTENGRYHEGGEVRFRAAVDLANRGVRLRRRIDRKTGRQKAVVFVDGRLAGVWYDAEVNEYLRWADSDFEIHPSFTAGKKSLEVRLKVERSSGEGPFSDFSYTTYCYMK